jgi:pyridoxine 5-phosphate synthase
MVNLSVNINKIATLRNARGHDNPNVVDWAKKIQSYGAHGITVHPRPDERHIKYQDIYDLKSSVDTEFNIEGYPNEYFINLVLEVKPTQVTLVPDDPGQLTSDHGWDVKKHSAFLKNTIKAFRDKGIRTSIFLDPIPELMQAVKETGTDRIELYTESYASQGVEVIESFIKTAQEAAEFGIGVNAGHDLDLENLRLFVEKVPNLLEVSIGHALICDALEFGMKNTIEKYLELVK